MTQDDAVARWVEADASECLAEVASRMRFNDVSVILVRDARGVVGSLSERDMTRAIADGVDPLTTPAGDYATPVD